MTSAEPLVSVLTPSYNQRRWLGDNLDSVARQTYERLEHVVMDGGSTDGSVDILRISSGNVRWRSEPDHGQSDALNKAFADSRGEIIGWLNSDDAYYSVDAVRDAVTVFRDRPDVDVVYGHAALVNSEGLILHIVWVPPRAERIIRRYNVIIQPAAFIRRSAVTDRFVDDRYNFAMDNELWLQLARRGRVFARLNKVLAIDREQPHRKSTAQGGGAVAEIEQLMREYGVPNIHGLRYRAPLKVLNVASRFAGLRIVMQPLPTLAFHGRVDNRAQLAVRQVAVKRAAMPIGM
jgi:glycosyltransferase involved in cell wall biosynthesis